jgi:two-component system sensor histidine kinase DesK
MGMTLRRGITVRRGIPVRRWQARTQLQRFEALTRWPLFVISGTEPLTAALLVLSQGQGQGQIRLAGAATLLGVALLHTVACLRVLRAAIGHRVGGPPPARRPTVAMIALAVAGLAAGRWAFPDLGATPPSSFPAGLAVALVFYGGSVAAITPVVRRLPLVVLVIGPVVVTGILQRAQGLWPGTPDGGPSLWAVDCLIWLGTIVLTYRSGAWGLAIMTEMDQARIAQARLAVAEERLRFSRDLHDVLGRNLALIAVNSDLAAQLARRGQDGAVDQMLAVHRTAQDCMRELREVVGGYRHADLDVELAGARSVLRSAGIDVEVIGDGTRLPAGVQAALGWVVREGVTNIVRHSAATRVRIELAVMAGTAVLRIENDGVPPAASRVGQGAAAGTGLLGLRERLAERGGAVTAEPLPGNRFHVHARLPLAIAGRPAREQTATEQTATEQAATEQAETEQAETEQAETEESLS